MPHRRNPRTLLSAPMRSVLDRMARAARSPLQALTPAQARAFYEAGSGMLEPPPHKLARVQDLTIPARDGAALPARLYAPSHEVLPVLLYFHGGGFTIGSIATHDGLCRTLSHLAHCAVLSLDYRLAPEHKFPTAANDAWDALLWLSRHAKSLGLDGTRLAVGGDSAGGTLAAVCAIEAREAHLALALQLLFYPGCSAWQDMPSHQTFGHGFLLEQAQILWMFDHYLRDPADRDDWRFAPLDGRDAQGATIDAQGLAPAWLGLAECDPLLDEGLMYGDKLRAGGVAVDLEIYRGVVHEFIKMGRVIPEAHKALQDAAKALQHAFAQPQLV
jgi:acetyl esterase